MCRLAAYIGPQLPLSHLLLKPEHGLMEQSWEPKELNESRLNADGYGFAWFDINNIPASYRNPMPIWSDANLEPLGRTLSSRQWFANVRSATLGLDVNLANTQPFADEKLIYLHNGYVKNFNGEHRVQFQSLINAEHDKGIYGTTDSEYIFALIRQTANENPELPIPDVLRHVFQKIKEIVKNSRALLNIVIGDGDKIYAFRHAINGDCPSLYFNVKNKSYPEGQLIVSEPFNDSGNWQLIPENNFIILDGKNKPDLMDI